VCLLRGFDPGNLWRQPSVEEEENQLSIWGLEERRRKKERGKHISTSDLWRLTFGRIQKKMFSTLELRRVTEVKLSSPSWIFVD